MFMRYFSNIINFCFNFGKESRNISDNLVRDGFRPQICYHYRGQILFHREGFCRTYLFQQAGCGNVFLIYEKSSQGFFFVLNIGKQKSESLTIFSSSKSLELTNLFFL